MFIFLVITAYLAAILWYWHRNSWAGALEGAELIQFRQLEMAAKDRPAEIPSANVPPPPAIDKDRK